MCVKGDGGDGSVSVSTYVEFAVGWSTSHGGIAESLANFANFVVGSFHEHAGCPW